MSYGASSVCISNSSKISFAGGTKSSIVISGISSTSGIGNTGSASYKHRKFGSSLATSTSFSSPIARRAPIPSLN